MAINQYTTPVQNSLEQYVPLPLEQVYKAASAIQARGDVQQNQNDQVQTGLSSMEALAPGHRDFVNQFANDFKTQQAALLDKYHGNTSDPMYDQESRRLNMQFAADPRLQIIKQSNELYKKKQNIADELNAKGIKYIDSNPNFTGKDSNGNLTSNVGYLHATNFDSNINQAFKDKENAIEQIGHTLTNRNNLAKVHSSYMNPDGSLNTDSKDIQEGLAYYKQQGLSDQDAAAKVANHVNQGLGYAHDLKDHFYEMSPYQSEELKLRWQELAEKKAKEKQQGQIGPPPFQLEDYIKPIVKTGSTSDSDISNSTPNSDLFHKIKSIDLDKNGNLKNTPRYIDATPENMKANPGLKPVYQSYIGDRGMDTTPRSLKLDGYNPDEVNLLKTARKVLGVTDGTAKDVLSKYSDLIKSYDQSSYKVTSTDNKKLNDVMAEVARRQISTGEVYKLSDNGAPIKITDPKELNELQTSANSEEKDNEIKNIQIAGISPKNLGPMNGFTQFSNKGKSYYTPLPDQMQQHFTGSKAVENYIQDFDPKKIQETSIPTNTGVVKALIDPNQEPIRYVYQGLEGKLLPYKANQGGKLGGGGLFQYKDPSTGEIKVAPIPLSELEREEKTSLFTRVVNDNKIKGD